MGHIAIQVTLIATEIRTITTQPTKESEVHKILICVILLFLLSTCTSDVDMEQANGSLPSLNIPDSIAFPIFTLSGMGLVNGYGDTLASPEFRFIEPRHSLTEFRIFNDSVFIDYAVGQSTTPIDSTYLQQRGKPFSAIDSFEYFSGVGEYCDVRSNITYWVDQKADSSYVYYGVRSLKTTGGYSFILEDERYYYENEHGSVVFRDTAVYLSQYLRYSAGPQDRSDYTKENNRLLKIYAEQQVADMFTSGSTFYKDDLATFLLGISGMKGERFHGVLCKNRIYL